MMIHIERILRIEDIDGFRITSSLLAMLTFDGSQRIILTFFDR
jgi:hypothetical protein